jgi:hypothetical protein
MRLYGGRILKNRVSQQITNRQEMRDAIVMSVDSTNKYALVKIQGSNTSIKAWYPENWESTPNFLKVGNSVRINQPGGNKARIEIMGMGMLLPTAVPGGSVTPTPEALADTVLTGCVLNASDPYDMSVVATAGTFRIDEVTYSLSGLMMDNASVIMGRYDLIMGQVGAVVTLDAASATKFRYDTLCVGTDGIVDIVKGAEFATTDTIPDPPAATTDHLFLGFVLLPPNTTTITPALINQLYTVPVASRIVVEADDNPMTWATTTTDVHLSIRDQYNNYYQNAVPGWQFNMEWTGALIGTGTFSYGGVSSVVTAYDQDPKDDLAVVYTGSTSATVTYTRNELITESSPAMKITEAITGFNTLLYLQLEDSYGDIL